MAEKFVILHGLVDMHRFGEVVDFAESKIDTARLEALGAIRRATKDDDGPQVAYGTPSDLAASPLPVIPPPAAAATTVEKSPPSK